jgi:hypothetical protein
MHPARDVRPIDAATNESPIAVMVDKVNRN